MRGERGCDSGKGGGQKGPVRVQGGKGRWGEVRIMLWHGRKLLGAVRKKNCLLLQSSPKEGGTEGALSMELLKADQQSLGNTCWREQGFLGRPSGSDDLILSRLSD